MDRHLLFDRALHTFEADAELILKQLADCADAPIAEVIDIISLVNRALLFINRITTHLQDVLDDLKEIARLQKRILDALHLRLAHLDIEFQATDAREVELARIEKHSFQQAICSLHRRWVAGTHLAIDFQQRIHRLADCVLLKRLRNDDANIVTFGKEHRESLHTALGDFLKLRRHDLVVRFNDHLTGFGIYHVGGSVRTFELIKIDFDLTDIRFPQTFERSASDFLALTHNRVGSAALNLEIDLHADEIRLA